MHLHIRIEINESKYGFQLSRPGIKYKYAELCIMQISSLVNIECRQHETPDIAKIFRVVNVLAFRRFDLYQYILQLTHFPLNVCISINALLRKVKHPLFTLNYLSI